MIAPLRDLARRLWPFVSRRRFREAQQLAVRLQLGKRLLAVEVRELSAQLRQADADHAELSGRLQDALDVVESLRPSVDSSVQSGGL